MIQTHSYTKWESIHFLRRIKVIDPNPRETIPLRHSLTLSPLCYYTSKGISVSQGYTLPVWCYASQVMIGVLRQPCLSEGCISRNRLYAAHFFVCWWVKAQRSYSTALQEDLMIQDPWASCAWQPLRHLATWLMLDSRNLTSNWLTSCFFFPMKTMEDESAKEEEGTRVI